jgi:hypothetical protein
MRCARPGHDAKALRGARAASKIAWRKWLTRRIWYPLGYQILREGRILRRNPPDACPGGIAVLNEPHEANEGSTRWNNVVDPGYEVDPVHPGPPDQPQSPDPPR